MFSLLRLSSSTKQPKLGRSNPAGPTKLRTTDYKLADYHHGKSKVRVLRVRQDGATHTVQHYDVLTRLFSPDTADVYTREDNATCVATDTQRNAVYLIAKRSKATTLEGYALDLANHFLREYPFIAAMEVEVSEILWQRYTAQGQVHNHGFTKAAPETATVFVRIDRGEPPVVVSGFKGLVVLKTTQSGFSGFPRDMYTLLPETTERCMATEMDATWKYMPGTGGSPSFGCADFAATRAIVRTQLLRAFFGEPTAGVFSASLQATVYDGGCLVLENAPAVKSVSIETPNIHMIPWEKLNVMGEAFEDDVYVATSDPSGSIHCEVSR